MPTAKKTIGEKVQEKDKITKTEYNAVVRKADELEIRIKEIIDENDKLLKKNTTLTNKLEISDKSLQKATIKLGELEEELLEKNEKIGKFISELNGNLQTYSDVKISHVLKKLNEILSVKL
ncbi:MAG: hypothetical protein ACOC33_00385 [bacterium]